MICLVTDRRRLAGAAASADGWRSCLLAQVGYAVQAGVDLIQVRERDLDAGPLAALVTSLLTLTAGTSTRLVVNDRIDVAIACGADGVHLRGDSLPIAAARRLAPAGFLVGRSVHRVAEAIAARDADYLIGGTVFASASKPGSSALLGLDGLQAIARAVDLPVLAIGGISRTQLHQVAATGAAGVAAIGLFMASPTGTAAICGATDLLEIVERARLTFDRLNTSP